MAKGTGSGAFLMVSLIEPIPIRHVETLMELELRLLRDLADPGGCACFPDPGLDCCFLSDAREVLRQAIGRAWGLKDYEE